MSFDALKRALTILFIAFLFFHVAAITWTNLMHIQPFYPRMAKASWYQKVNSFFDVYLIGTGNAQRWNLFTSVSDIHDQEIIIEVVDPKGRKYHFDPILPGLREYDAENIRHLSLFLRFIYGMENYVAPYMQRAIKEIEAGGTEVKEAYLLINQKKTRYLENIREDRQIYYSDPHKFGPYVPRK